MKFGSMSRLLWSGVAGLLLGPVARAELDLAIEVGGGYSDNIRRVDVDETDEKIGIVGLDLLWTQRTRRLDANVTADLSYYEYLDDTFESEVVGIADGSLTLGILPERLTWLFQDSFGQVQSDPFSPITPDTRENLNYFTTGPDLILRLGSAASVRLFGRYALTDYEDSPLDAERTSAGFSLARSISRSSEIALNGVSEQIDFEESGGGDYDRDSAFLSYNLDGARTDVTTELGYTWLKPDGGETSGGLLASVLVIRDVSASSTVQLELGTEFTDAGDALRGAIEGGAVGGPDITATGDPFETRTASLRWNFLRNRTGLSLGVAWNEDRYEQQTLLDRTRIAYEAGFTRRMTSALDFSLRATLDDEEFDNTGLEADELRLAARLSWRLGRTISLALSAERFDRSTSDGIDEYVENRAFLTVSYRPIRGSASSGAP